MSCTNHSWESRSQTCSTSAALGQVWSYTVPQTHLLYQLLTHQKTQTKQKELCAPHQVCLDGVTFLIYILSKTQKTKLCTSQLLQVETLLPPSHQLRTLLHLFCLAQSRVTVLKFWFVTSLLQKYCTKLWEKLVSIQITGVQKDSLHQACNVASSWRWHLWFFYFLWETILSTIIKFYN